MHTLIKHKLAGILAAVVLTVAAAGGAGPDLGHHQRAVGHVGIVAGILDNTGRGLVCVLARDGKREHRPLAVGQRDLDRIGEFARQQRRIGGLCSRRRAGACRPAAAQRAVIWAVFQVHVGSYRASGISSHGRVCRP